MNSFAAAAHGRRICLLEFAIVLNTGKNNQFPFWEFYRVFGEFPRKSQICESETIPRITTWEFTIPYMGIYYSQYWKMFQYWEFNCLRLALKIWELPNLYLGFFQFKFRGT